MPAPDPPKVSVVMSVYDGAPFLREAVESILDQTFEDFEFLIINDGSIDDTAKILSGFSDLRIRILENEKNEGLTNCLIKGCLEARGKYIARMDADDVSHVERLQKQVEFLDAHPACAVVGANCNYIDGKGKIRSVSNYDLDYDTIQKMRMQYSPFCHGATMFVKERILACGNYRELFRSAQDYDLWLRVVEKHEVANLEEPYYSLRIHAKTVTTGHQYIQGRFADLAREMARIREVVGSDLLMRRQENEAARMVASFYPSSFWRHWREKSRSNIFVAGELLHRRFPGLAAGLILKAFCRNPFEKSLWRLVFSGRLVSAIRRQ